MYICRRAIRSLVAGVVLLASPHAVAGGGNELDEGALQSLFNTMQYRSIGPARGGRATTCCGVPGHPMIYYMGATGGGVWKTENGGHSWRNISDGWFGTGSVGAIAVAESDPNVVYVGMGERDIRGNFSHGDGMYKSLDAGQTWKHVGLSDTRQIAKVRVHPANPDLVYVAALGHIFGPNEQRGVFRSSDGGETWEKILYVNDETGAIDIAMDPNNPRVLYAGFWQTKRTPWSLESGGPGSGMYKSTDGGDTWEELTRGLPRGIAGKYGISVSPVDSSRVYAIIEAEQGGVFRSDNAGQSWRRVNEDRSLRQRAWYYTHIYADTQDIDTVYVLNVGFHKSTNGGQDFDQRIRVPHGDNHDLWIHPDNNQIMVNANDGGANVSYDAGASWSQQNMQPTAQFYHVITDDQFPYRVYGAQQDNSTACVSSQGSPFRWEYDFYSVGGGESGYIAPTPDGSVVYAGSYGGFLTRYDHATRTSRNIMVWPENPMGWGVENMKYRFQWTFPIVLSRHDPEVLYVGANMLFRSTNEGQSWEAISPDLTTDDKSKQVSSGGPITQDNTSVEYYCTIFSVAESHHDADVIWVGSDDGLVHITRDGGETWQNITPAGLGEWSLISLIEASPHEPGTAYLAVNRYKMDDFRPYIFKTSNFGETWEKITTGIDEDAFVRAVREDPNRRGLLYAGTETGVWVSFDDGGRWQPLQLNLPVSPVTDLVVKNDDLVVATQGRSFWILDDLTPLHQVDAVAGGTGVHLFRPRDTYRVGRGGSVNVRYYLGEEPKDAVKLEFLEADGDVIQSYTGGRVSKNAGVNRFSWNTRYEDAVDVPGAVMWGGSGAGPQAAPGEYQVRLTVGERTLTQPLRIHGDPRLPTTQAEYEAQFDLLIAIRDRLSECNRAINELRSVREQVRGAANRAAKALDDASAIKDAAEQIVEQLAGFEEELIQHRSKSGQDPLNYPIKLNNKIAAIAGTISAGYGPTDQAREAFENLSARLRVQLDALAEVIDADVPAFNKLIEDARVPAVILDESDSPERR